jgi:hypothetical protein
MDENSLEQTHLLREISLRDLADQPLILTRVVKNVVDRQDEAIDDLRERMLRVESKLSEDE